MFIPPTSLWVLQGALLDGSYIELWLTLLLWPHSFTHKGVGDSSVVRAAGPVTERSRVRIPAGTAGEFSSPWSTFCADSYFGIRSISVLPQ